MFWVANESNRTLVQPWPRLVNANSIGYLPTGGQTSIKPACPSKPALANCADWSSLFVVFAQL